MSLYNTPSPKNPNSFASPQRSPQCVSPQRGTSFPETQCTCQNCQYYRHALMYAPDGVSPHMDQYAMYPYTFYAPVPMAMPYPTQQSQSMPRGRSQSQPQHQHQQQQQMQQQTSPAIAEAHVMEKVGSLAEYACIASGRSAICALLEAATPEHVSLLAKELIPQLEKVALDTHGAHCLRKLIECLDAEQVEALLDNVNETLVLNMSTVSHDTRKILEVLFESHRSLDLQVIVDMMTKNAQYLAATQQGCISMMKVIERCAQHQKNQLLAPLVPMFVELSCDTFGNYVVQHALEHWDRAFAANHILEQFNGHLLEVSCTKAGSHVVESILKNVNLPAVRRMVLDELIFNPASLQELVSDNFGNYVVQHVIESCENAGELKKVADRLRPVLPQTRFGNHIETRLRNKRFGGNSRGLSNITNKQRGPRPMAPVC